MKKENAHTHTHTHKSTHTQGKKTKTKQTTTTKQTNKCTRMHGKKKLLKTKMINGLESVKS